MDETLERLPEPFWWLPPPEGPALALLDQTRLPAEEAVLAHHSGVPFDVTPTNLVTAVVTERGVIDPVDMAGLRRVCECYPTPMERLGP